VRKSAQPAMRTRRSASPPPPQPPILSQVGVKRPNARVYVTMAARQCLVRETTSVHSGSWTGPPLVRIRPLNLIGGHPIGSSWRPICLAGGDVLRMLFDLRLRSRRFSTVLGGSRPDVLEMCPDRTVALSTRHSGGPLRPALRACLDVRLERRGNSDR
jgi:hypothetical protein